MSPTTRLPLLPPATLSPDQRDLYDDMVEVIDGNFGDLVARGDGGALIGPFNGWLHFPQFGRPAWAFNKSLYEHAVLPAAIHQLGHPGDRGQVRRPYEIHGHEYFARRAGLAERKIATIVAGERPSDLGPDGSAAYDMAAALNRGRAACPDDVSGGARRVRGAGAGRDRVPPGRMLLDGGHHTQRVRRRVPP